MRQVDQATGEDLGTPSAGRKISRPRRAPPRSKMRTLSLTPTLSP